MSLRHDRRDCTGPQTFLGARRTRAALPNFPTYERIGCAINGFDDVECADLACRPSQAESATGTGRRLQQSCSHQGLQVLGEVGLR